jgi:hypothetical protein
MIGKYTAGSMPSKANVINRPHLERDLVTKHVRVIVIDSGSSSSILLPARQTNNIIEISTKPLASVRCEKARSNFGYIQDAVFVTIQYQ